MNFIPENNYAGLLAQAKAMHRIIEAMEKSRSIQEKVIDDLTKQLLICGKDHIESEREANQILTDQVLRLEQERDQLKAVIDQCLEAMCAVSQAAYYSAVPVCCGNAAGTECCGSPEPEWSEYDKMIMDTLSGPINAAANQLRQQAKENNDDE